MRAWVVRLTDMATYVRTVPLIYALPASALAILLQIQISLFRHEGYLGLRINAADLILPLLGLLVLARLAFRKDRLPAWRIPGFYIWISALSGLMIFALLNGYNNSGEWNIWALVNKFTGWFVLLGYLGLGGWIAHSAGQQGIAVVKSVSLIFWGIVTIASLAWLISFDLKYDLTYYPMGSLMANRNAYAFLWFCMLALMTTSQMCKTGKPVWWFYGMWALVPLFYVYNGSRAGFVVFAFLMLVFGILHFRFTLRHILPPLLAGILACTLVYSNFSSYAYGLTSGNIRNSAQLIQAGKMSREQANQILIYEGDKMRIRTYGDALELWSRHPVTGGGLGSFQTFQIEKHGEFKEIIDCTFLWLLAETGLAGLLALTMFFAMGLWALFKQIRKHDPTGLYLATFLMMAIFAIMSLVHELLYTRFLWFFMGLALAWPKEHAVAVKEA